MLSRAVNGLFKTELIVVAGRGVHSSTSNSLGAERIDW